MPLFAKSRRACAPSTEAVPDCPLPLGPDMSQPSGHIPPNPELGKGRGAMLGRREASFGIEEPFVITSLGGCLIPKYCLRFC